MLALPLPCFCRYVSGFISSFERRYSKLERVIKHTGGLQLSGCWDMQACGGVIGRALGACLRSCRLANAQQTGPTFCARVLYPKTALPTPLPSAVSRTLLPSPDKKKGAGSSGGQKAAKGKAPAVRRAAGKAAKA